MADRDLAGPSRGLLAGGVLLLLGSLFLPWFSGFRGDIEIPNRSTGWQWLDNLDIFLLTVCLFAVGVLVLLSRIQAADLLWVARGLLGAVGISLFLVIFRWMVPPERFEGFTLQMDRGIGPAVALLGTLLLSAGAFLAMRAAEEPTT